MLKVFNVFYLIDKIEIVYPKNQRLHKNWLFKQFIEFEHEESVSDLPFMHTGLSTRV